MDEPRPLIDPDGGDALARLVRSARAMEVEYDLDEAVARHERLVAAGVPPLTASGRGLRWAWWGSAGVLIAGAAIVAAQPGAEVRPAEAAVVVASAPIETVANEPTREEVERPTVAASVGPPEPAIERAPARAKSKPRAVASTDAASAVADAAKEDDGDRIAREAAQVRRIRELLDAGDAKGAWAACEAGDREFARGVFSLEREGLRTLAALALDRAGAADDARAYLEQHPRAPLARRIRDALR